MKLKPKQRKVLIDISVVLVVILVVLGIYFGFRVALATATPWVAVASESMKPALEVGDLVIVQGAPASEIKAGDKDGDIIVFKPPGAKDYTVHRVIMKETLANGTVRFRTKGDAATEDPDWTYEQDVQGRVLYRILYIGWLVLDPTILIIIIATIVAIVILWPESRRKRRKI